MRSHSETVSLNNISNSHSLKYLFSLLMSFKIIHLELQALTDRTYVHYPFRKMQPDHKKAKVLWLKNLQSILNDECDGRFSHYSSPNERTLCLFEYLKVRMVKNSNSTWQTDDTQVTGRTVLYQLHR